MQTDELKDLWQRLEQRLERQQQLDLALVQQHTASAIDDRLAPLRRGQWLQLLLGIGLLLLGAACWSRNLQVLPYLLAGITVHGFGVLTAALAATTLLRLRRLQPSGPVLQVEQRLARLRRWQAFNAMLAGWPWWLMWVLLPVAAAGIARLPATPAAAPWLLANLGIGVLGWLGTAWWQRRARKSREPAVARHADDLVSGYSLRQASALLQELRRFEQQ